MSAQHPTNQTGQDPRQVTEDLAWSWPGVRALLVGIAGVIASGVMMGIGAAQGSGHGGVAATLVIAGIVVLVLAVLTFRGLTAVVPGEARAVQLCGRYRGTIRTSGLHWVNPFSERRKVSTRVRNHETAIAKVNDADGNPVEIAAVVVWQVHDTAKAIYSVNDVTKFVAIQSEAAVRHTASSYPYDSRGSGALSLRDNADEITQQLTDEISERVKAAGVDIVESRLT